ncbi:MAG: hypothetical protein ACE5GM_09025, partial [bacterium]
MTTPQAPPQFPLSTANQQVLRKLFRTLDQAPGRIVFAQVNQIRLQEWLLKEITSSFQRDHRSCRILSLAGEQSSLYRQVKQALAEFPAPLQLLVVTGWETIFKDKDETGRQQYLREFNLGREAFSTQALEGTRLLLLLPDFVRQLILRYAPDFYDWRVTLLKFEEDAYEPSLTWQETTTDSHLRVRLQETITLQEQQLSRAREEGTDSRTLLSQYLLPLANSYYRNYDWENSLSRYKQALSIEREIGDKSGEGTTLNNISA